MTSSEKNLLERFRSGEESAFDELYRLMHERIYRFALRLTGNAHDAEDVTVLAFTEAYRSRQSYRGTSTVETWLYRITVYSAARQKRKRRHHPMPDHDLTDPAGNEHVQALELQQMLSALPEDLRKAFLLVRVEGLTHREASEVLGKRLGTVQSHVFQAGKLLREQLLLDPPQVKRDHPTRCIL